MAHYDVPVTDANRIAGLAGVLEHELSNAGDVPDPVRKAAEWLIADVRHLLTPDKGTRPSWALMAAELLGYKDGGE